MRGVLKEKKITALCSHSQYSHLPHTEQITKKQNKKVSKQNSINRKDKAQIPREMHKPRHSTSSSQVCTWRVSHKTEAVGTQVCTTEGKSSKRVVSWERCGTLGQLGRRDVTQDSRHVTGNVVV